MSKKPKIERAVKKKRERKNFKKVQSERESQARRETKLTKNRWGWSGGDPDEKERRQFL